MRLDRALAAIEALLRAATAAALLLMMLLIVGDAVGRTINVPIPGAVEVTEEYLMVAVVFLAMGATWSEGRHIRIEFFERILPWVRAPVIRLAVSAVALLYFGLIAYQGAGQTAYALRIGQRSTSELAYPLAPAYALVVVGSAVTCLWLALDILLAAREATFGRTAGKGHERR